MPDRRTRKNAPVQRAMELLDPEGTLEPGTRDYEDTEAMVTNWINKYGPAEAYEMIRKCMELLEGTKAFYKCDNPSSGISKPSRHKK